MVKTGDLRLGTCLNCDRVKKILAKGLCGTCYQRVWRLKNPLKYQKQRDSWLKKQQKHTINRRKKVLTISKVCQKCGFNNTLCLDLHHKDFNHNNNVKNNLMVLCRNCHFLVHLGDNRGGRKRDLYKKVKLEVLNGF